MKKALLLVGVLCLSLLVEVAWAQQRTVTGKVTSEESGEPLPGVNVVLRGTNVGSITDLNGYYNVVVQSDAGILVFSFIGLETQEVQVGTRSAVNVAMKADVKQLGEVVVTALGIERESKGLGYSVESVSSEDLNRTQQPNVLEALSGKVAGVVISTGSGNMAGSSRVLIRGANSVSGENEPLFIVDGIPMANTNINSDETARGGGGIDWGSPIQDINPDDIESVSVLKGPQAAALYGSRAANGVIMVTTKKGRTSKKQLGISVNTGVSFEQVSILPKLQRNYGGGYDLHVLGYDDNTGYYKTSYNELDEDGNVVGTYQSFDLVPDYGVDESHGPAYKKTSGEYIEQLKGSQYENEPLMYRPWNSWDEWDSENYGKSIQWKAPENDIRDYFETGVAYNTNISLTGNSEVGSFRVSYTNLTSSGYFPNSEYDKNVLSSVGDLKLGSRLTGNASLNYVNAAALGRPVTGYDDNNVMQKFVQWGQRQLDMKRLSTYKNPDGSQRTWNRASWDDPTPVYSDNPYWTAFENYTEDVRDRFFGSSGLTYKFTEYLQLSGNARGDFYTWRTEDRVSIGSQAQSSYTEGIRTWKEMNYEAMLRFDKQILPKIGVNAFIGANLMHQEYNRNLGTTDGGLVLPGLYNLGNSGNAAQSDDYEYEKEIQSVFGNLSLNWKEMIYVDATFRNDWSSTLPQGNNSYFYPSLNGSLIFTELPVFNNLNIISFGKIRGGWAQVGNDTDPYNILNIYAKPLIPGSDPPIGVPNISGLPLYSVPNTMYNSELRPEKTRSWELGAELGFFKDRLNIDFTYYDMKTFDLITDVAISGASGYLYRYVNAGVMTNKGIELAINGNVIQTTDFDWNIGVNFSRNRNKLVELYGETDNYRLINGPFNISVNAFVGKPYGQLMGTAIIRDEAGNPVLRSTGSYAGMPYRSADAVPLGTVLPDYNMGISSGVRYKGIRLSGLISVQKGGHYFSTSHMWGTYSGMFDATGVEGYREDGVLLDGVIGDNVTINEDGVTAVVENSRPNDIHGNYYYYGYYHYSGPAELNIFKADYMKLKELKLSYALPAAITGPLKNAEIAFWGRNLLTWGLDNPNFDPETVVTNSGNIQGIEGAALPSTRTYGLNLKFDL